MLIFVGFFWGQQCVEQQITRDLPQTLECGFPFDMRSYIPKSLFWGNKGYLTTDYTIWHYWGLAGDVLAWSAPIAAWIFLFKRYGHDRSEPA